MKSSKFKVLSAFVVVFLLIYISHETLLFGTNVSKSIVVLGQYFIIIIALAFFAYSFITKKKLDFFLIIIVALIFLVNILMDSKYNNYVYKFSIILLSYSISTIFTKEQFMKAFMGILVFLGTYSIFTILFYNIIPAIINNFPLIINVSGASYRHLFFSSVLTNGVQYFGVTRNWGIFREPGVYAIYLILALYFYLFEIRRNKIIVVLIIIISIISTFSTAGIIVMFIMLFTKILNDKQKYLFNNRYLMLLLFLLIFGGFTELLSPEGIIFHKFNVESNNFGSSVARIQSIFRNIEIFIKNPIFGNGIYRTYEEFPFYYQNMFVVDNTNSFLMIYSMHGIFLGTVFLVGWYYYLKNNKNAIVSVLLLVSFIMVMSNQDMTQNVLFYIPAFYGLKTFLGRDRQVKI